MMPSSRNLYVNYEYINTLNNIGDPYKLPNLDLACVKRFIPNEEDAYDIIGPYPFILFEDVENELSQINSTVKKFDNNVVTFSLILLFMDAEKIQKVIKIKLDYLRISRSNKKVCLFFNIDI